MKLRESVRLKPATIEKVLTLCTLKQIGKCQYYEIAVEEKVQRDTEKMQRLSKSMKRKK